jgi:signal transduction histidine kinase
MSEEGTTRLNKRMSELGLCSRREADEWIERGWVRVDGELARMGQQVPPEAKITIDARGGQRGSWDCARISQALSNLVTNAVEHGGERTPVTVTLGGDDVESLISVHNDGATISDEQLDGIFGPMKSRESANRSGSSPSGNLGLGLYIAERIVAAHGGRIDVASSSDKGTTFTMHLPRHKGASS